MQTVAELAELSVLQQAVTGRSGREMPELPAWMVHGRCREVDPELFFAAGRGDSTYARDAGAVCAACPVQADCLEYALEHQVRYGVWGGLTPTERKPLEPDTAAEPEPAQQPSRCKCGPECCPDGCRDEVPAGGGRHYSWRCYKRRQRARESEAA